MTKAWKSGDIAWRISRWRDGWAIRGPLILTAYSIEGLWYTKQGIAADESELVRDLADLPGHMKANLNPLSPLELPLLRMKHRVNRPRSA